MEHQPPTIETVEHEGHSFVKLDPEHIKQEAMGQAHKVKDVFAYQLAEGEEVTIETRANGLLETTNIARAGDWVVYNIGTGTGDTLDEQIDTCDQKVIKREMFELLYAPKEDEGDTNKRGSLYEYIGQPIYIARVPFPFYHNAPWGERQFIEAGGYIVYNPNTREWYGTAGARNRKAGQFETTYALGDSDENPINLQYKMVIAADRSPLPGIQFNNVDLARAYQEAGKNLGKLEKYL